MTDKNVPPRRKQEYSPDAGVPARGEVAVHLSGEARVFAHHRFGGFEGAGLSSGIGESQNSSVRKRVVERAN